MKQILKHSFEAVSLLTTNNGMLEVTIVPASNQPDWIIPSALILSVEDCQERTTIYDWQQQALSVFHLLSKDDIPERIIVLEGNTDKHRFALQTVGELKQLQARISDVKDIDIPKQMLNSNADVSEGQSDEDVVLSYLYQTVMIDDNTYLVPDLDKIAHHLANSDD